MAPAAQQSARARAARRGAETGGEGEGVISFREAILPDVTLEEPVDAVIGRLILGHLRDPVTALRRLSRPVRPGGLIAFQDFDNHPLRVVPAPPPLTGAVLQTVAEALTVDGTDLGAGARLYSLFQEAGASSVRDLGDNTDGRRGAWWLEAGPGREDSGLSVAGAVGVSQVSHRDVRCPESAAGPGDADAAVSGGARFPRSARRWSSRVPNPAGSGGCCSRTRSSATPGCRRPSRFPEKGKAVVTCQRARRRNSTTRSVVA